MREVTIAEEVADITCRFYLTGDDPDSRNEVLIVSVDGHYRDGSSGRSDAWYMRHMVEMGSEFWRHGGLVIDLVALRYDWGDEMEMIFDFLENYTPAAIVVGPACRPALSTLLFGLHTQRDVTEQEGVFDNVDAAIQYVRTRAEQRDAQYKRDELS